MPEHHRPFEAPEATALFDSWYDPATIRAIDRQLGEPARSVSTSSIDRADAADPALRGARRAAVAGAVAASLFTGAAEALELEAEQTFEEIDHGIVGGPDQPVTLYFVPNDPRATTAIVRPWLFDTTDVAVAARPAAQTTGPEVIA